MKNEPFVFERTYNATASKVWQAITNKDDMRNWYFDLPEFRAEPGFEFEFSAGRDEGHQYLHACRVIEVVPGKKLTYTWRYPGYDGNSFVTFELFEEQNGTRVRLTHEGLESFPANNPDLARDQFAEGWRQIIGESLKKYVEES